MMILPGMLLFLFLMFVVVLIEFVNPLACVNALKKWFTVKKMVVLVFIFLFYWFQIRPAKIRSYCAENSPVTENELDRKLKTYLQRPGRKYSPGINTKTYEDCLHLKGLK